jgi:sugar phosphate isomerase/epimerase
VDGLTKDQGQEIIGGLAERGITISGLGYYPNPLHADAAHREEVIGHLMKVITGAATMGYRCRQHLRRRGPDAQRGRELDPGAGDFRAHREARPIAA